MGGGGWGGLPHGNMHRNGCFMLHKRAESNQQSELRLMESVCPAGLHVAADSCHLSKSREIWGEWTRTPRSPSDGMLTKVNELFHGQRRRGELGKPLHLLRYPKDGAIFHQKLSELHFASGYKGSRLSPTRPSATAAKSERA